MTVNSVQCPPTDTYTFLSIIPYTQNSWLINFDLRLNRLFYNYQMNKLFILIKSACLWRSLRVNLRYGEITHSFNNTIAVVKSKKTDHRNIHQHVGAAVVPTNKSFYKLKFIFWWPVTHSHTNNIYS